MATKTLSRPLSKTRALCLRVTTEDEQALRDLAWSQGLHKSDYLRRLVVMAIRGQIVA